MAQSNPPEDGVWKNELAPNAPADWRIGKSYKLSFFSTQPGKTRAVSRCLNAVLEQQVGCDSASLGILVNLGHPDLLVSYPISSLDNNLAKAGTIKGITGSNQVIMFDWEPTSNLRPHYLVPYRARLAAGSCRLVSLVKLSMMEIHKNGLLAEWEFLNRVKDLEPDGNIKISLLGTVSWPECLLVIDGSDLGELFHHLYRINRECAVNPPSFHKSLTFTCLPIDVLSDDRAVFDSTIPSSFRERRVWWLQEGSDSAHEGMLISHLQVCSTTVAAPELARRLQQRFHSIQYTLGTTDLICRPRKDEYWADFLWNVLELRRTEPSIVTTRLIVGMNLPMEKKMEEGSPGLAFSRHVELPAPIEINEEHVKMLAELGPGVRESVARAIYTFNATLQDPVVSSTLWDMLPFVQKMVEYISMVPEKPLPTNQKTRWLERHSFQLKLGFEQRIAGIPSALEHLPSRVATLHGPQNRILVGLGALVRHIVEKKLARKWHGFITVRATMGKFGSDVQVVEVPAQQTLAPDLRGMLPVLHEAVHCAESGDNNQGIELFRYDTAAFQSLVTALKLDERDLPQFRRLVSDIGADIFVVEHCIAGCYNLYFESIIDELASAIECGLWVLVEQLLVRTGCVYLSWVMLHETQKLAGFLPSESIPIVPRLALERVTRDYWNWLRQKKIDLSALPEGRPEAQKVMERVDLALQRLIILLPWIHVCLDLDRGCPEANTRYSSTEHQREQAVNNREGILPADPSAVDPIELLLRKSSRKVSNNLQHTLSTYLVLWHQGIVETHYHLESNHVPQ